MEMETRIFTDWKLLLKSIGSSGQIEGKSLRPSVGSFIKTDAKR